MEITKLKYENQFTSLKEGDELLVSWNQEGEKWNKEMQGNKIYKILKIQKANTKSKYPNEIILKNKGNIFFNFDLFLTGESKILKGVYLLK